VWVKCSMSNQLSVSSTKIRQAIAADAAGLAQVHVATWRTTYKGLISDEVLAGLSMERREQYWLRQLEAPLPNSFVYVATQDEQVVGFSSGGAERTGDPDYQGEVYALYLLQEAQRRGVGRGLMDASAQSLLSNGMNNMLIWVLRDNPSRRFYEAMGGSFVREQNIEIGGQTLVEVAYGWKDLHSLVKKNA